MHFIINRQYLYKSLQKIISVISGRPRMPILSHVLLEVNDNCLYMTATDLEIEIVAKVVLEDKYSIGSSTVPGRKFFEICRSLSESSRISVNLQDNKLFVYSGSSKFYLSTLPYLNFPKLEKWNDETRLVISKTVLKKMIQLTQFSMGIQDVRYYLNGIFFETQDHILRIAATDGHRLASCETLMKSLLDARSIIIPRKGVIEILRLLNVTENIVHIQTNSNSIRMEIDNYIFTSKLIDGVFPKYSNVFIKQPKNILEIACDVLKHALNRVAILSNEKLRIVKFILTGNQLKITAHNLEHEASEEVLDVLYSGENMEVSFNVDYLLDILHVMDMHVLKFFFINEVSGVQIEEVSKCYGVTYVVMPIQI